MDDTISDKDIILAAPRKSHNPFRNALMWFREEENNRLLVFFLIGIMTGIIFAQATIESIREWCVLPDPVVYCKQNNFLRTTSGIPDVIIQANHVAG